MSLLNQSLSVDTQINIDLSPAESFAGIMVATIAVDGQIVNEEKHNLIVTLSRMKLFQSHTKDSISNMLKNLIQVIKTHNVDTLLNAAIVCLPEYLHETAFAVSTDVALSDGAMPTEELCLLSKLSKSLLIPQEQADKIIEVIMIKNKG